MLSKLEQIQKAYVHVEKGPGQVASVAFRPRLSRVETLPSKSIMIHDLMRMDFGNWWVRSR